MFKIKDISLYIIKDIKLGKDEIQIGLAKLLKFKKLTLEGTLVKK